MIFVDDKDFVFHHIKKNGEIQKKAKYNKVMAESFKELYTKYVPSFIDRIFEGKSGKDIVPQL